MNAEAEIAYAKINLALHVRRREADGYHAIETLFVFAEDGDRLVLDDTPGVRVAGEFAAALDPAEDNIVARAARAFAARHGGPVMGFRLDKRLPVAAGIGGGSADAAAALRLLARTRGIDDVDGLTAIAADLGADVPACLLSRPVRGVGRGDRLAPLDEPALAGRPLLLVNPRIMLATGPVFAAWDGIDRGPLDEGDAMAAARAGRNDLEAPARAVLPEIGAVLTLLDSLPGVTLARMSGSGATCFALFADQVARDAAAARVAAAQPGWWQMATTLRA